MLLSGYEFSLLLPVAVVVGVVVVLGRRKADEDWARTARQLGLRCQGAGLFGERTMWGRLGADEVRVKVARRGGNQQGSRTLYRYRYRHGPAFALEFRAEGFWAKLRAVFGSADIQIGVPAFDDAVVVRGRRATEIVCYLTPERRARIRSMLVSNRSCVISGSAITLERRGSDDGARVRQVLERMRSLAEVLRMPSLARAGPPPVPPAIERALRAQREARLEEAAEHLEQARKDGVPSHEIEIVEHELAGRAAPDVPEVEPKPEPPPWPEPEPAPVPEPVAEPTPVPEPEPAPVSEPGPAAARALDQESVCEAVFGGSVATGDSHALFEAELQGREVRWHGRLVRVEPYYYDRVFGDGPGARAVVEVAKVKGSMAFDEVVQVVLELPPDAATELEGRAGSELAFGGTLARCEPLVRNLYVAGGRCELSPPPGSAAS